MSKIPDFNNDLTNIPKLKKETAQQFRTLGVRLDLDDARRFKSEADARGLSNQKALVEAINRLMAEWGKASVAEVGSVGKGRK